MGLVEQVRVTKALWGYRARTQERYFNNFDYRYLYQGTGYGRTKAKAIEKALDNFEYERKRVKLKYEREIIRL